MATFQPLSKTNDTCRHSDANAGPQGAANNRRGAQALTLVVYTGVLIQQGLSPLTLHKLWSDPSQVCVSLLDLCTVPAPLTPGSKTCCFGKAHCRTQR